MKKLSKNTKVIICIAVVVLLFYTFRVVMKKDTKKAEVEYSTTLTSDEVNIYSSGKSSNVFYFIVAVKNKKLENSTFEFGFDSTINYEVSYENIHERKSLPIEYYLAAETDFDFENLDEFNKYLSDVKMGNDVDKNKEYDKYKADYKKNKSYADYMKNTHLYMVQLKVPNQNAVLNSVKLLERKVDKEGNEEVHDIFEVATNVKFVTTASNSNNDYTVLNDNNNSAIYYDGKIKYDFEIKCNEDSFISDVRTEKFQTTQLTTYKNGVLVNNGISCTKDDVIRFELVININKNQYFDDSLIIDINVDNRVKKIHSPQVFAPENKMLIIDEDINRYNEYFEYKFNK